ncbi:6-phosphogluconolactonase [Chlamydiota bacterium]
MEPYHVLDDRRNIAIPGDHDVTIAFAADLWIDMAREAIVDHGFFAVALSGGSTPKKIYQRLSALEDQLDWSKVFLFWSDERSVGPTNEASNYHMAMEEGGLNKLPIPQNQIFRMVAEEEIEANAKGYEDIILDKLGSHPFDLVMLGMGDDGHTASLFPHTQALTIKGRLVVPNFVPQNNSWRMTFTYECINRSNNICLYVVGAPKAEVLEKVLLGPPKPDEYPSQLIGTEAQPALWILDNEAGKNLTAHLKYVRESFRYRKHLR